MDLPKREKEKDQRIPKVIELRQQGKNWTQISEELDIPRKSLYNMRHTEGFMQVANDMWMEIMEDIQKQREAGETSPYHLDQAIKNAMKMFILMSGTDLNKLLGAPKEMTELDKNIETTEQRKQKEQLVKDIMKYFIPPEKHRAFITWLEQAVEDDTPPQQTKE